VASPKIRGERELELTRPRVGDGNLPACHRCVISDRECSYARKREILFRHSKLASVPGGESDGSSAGVLVEAKAHEPPARDAGQRSSPEAVLHGTPYSPYRSTRLGGRSHGYDVGPRPNTVSSGDLGSSPSPAAPPTPQTVQFEPAAAPRKLTALEGELLHFYVCNIVPWVGLLRDCPHRTTKDDASDWGLTTKTARCYQSLAALHVLCTTVSGR